MNDTEWFQGKSVSHQLGYIARVGIVVLAGIVLLALALHAKAEPLIRANVGDVSITIYSEECALKDSVTNLPKRATWEEKGKVYEGCAGAVPQLGVAMFYFIGDKTVAVVPGQLFEKIQSI